MRDKSFRGAFRRVVILSPLSGSLTHLMYKNALDFSKNTGCSSREMVDAIGHLHGLILMDYVRHLDPTTRRRTLKDLMEGLLKDMVVSIEKEEVEL